MAQLIENKALAMGNLVLRDKWLRRIQAHMALSAAYPALFVRAAPFRGFRYVCRSASARVSAACTDA
jgi:hypothetical protein